MKQKTHWMLGFSAIIAAAAIVTARGQTPPGLVGLWKGEGNVFDSVGTNNGSVINPPQLVGYGPGEVGQGFVLSGGWITIPDDPSLEPTSITLQAWVKGSPPGAFKYVMSKSRPGFAAYALYTAGNGGITFFVANGGALTLSPSADPTNVWDGLWHQVTGTYDGANLHLYIDGTEVGSGTPASGNISYSTALNSGALILGNDPTFSTAYIGGLDEVKIFNQALSAQDVSDTFTNSSSAASTNGLVSWYKAEGNLLDSWGQNDGIPVTIPSVAYVPGKDGQAFFPKLGYALVPDAPELEPTNVTVQAWVKSVAPSTFRYILNKSKGAGGISYGLYTGVGQGLVFLITQTDGTLVLSPAVRSDAVWDGSWHLASGVWDGTNAHIYLDGVEEGTGTVTTNQLGIDYTSPGPLVFGDYRNGGGLPFVGMIDNIEIFNRALSPQEIVATYAGTNLVVSWWNAASNANDVVGTNNGVLVGSASYTSSRSLNNNAFKTSGGAVIIADSPSLEPTRLTLEAQVRASAPGSNKYIVSKSDTSSAASYAFWTGPSGGLQFYVNIAGTGQIFSPDAGTNIWDGFYHLVDGTYDGSKVHLYVDGQEIGSGTTGAGAIEYGATQSSGELIFGDFSNVSSIANFSGSVDEVKLCNVALSAQQIAQNSFEAVMIVQQPQNQTVSMGSKTAISIWAQGPSPVQYQWTFNGTNIVGQTKSTLTLTNVGNANRGSYAVQVRVPSVTYTNGFAGEAFQMASGLVDIPNIPAYENDNFTIQMYARAIAPGTYQYLLAKDRAPIDQVYNDSYGFETAGDGGLTWLVILQPPPNSTVFGVVTASVGTNVWDGNWHQFTATWDGEFASLYVDGSLGQSVDSFGGNVAYGIGSANGDLLLGDIETPAGPFHFGGDIDEVKYFDHALSAQDVSDTFTDSSSAANTNGLVSWYRADGNVLDSAMSNDGTALPLPGALLSTSATILPAITLQNPAVAGGSFQATAEGWTGATCIILSSTNLSTWTPIYTNIVPFTFTSAVGGQGKQFYRAIVQ